jgi:hypothetical protein
MGVAGLFGSPIAGVVATALAPLIAQALSATDVNLQSAIKRFKLANSTLLTAEAKFQQDESWFEDLTNTVIKLLGVVTPIGSSIIRLPFQEIMQGIGVVSAAADKLVNNVANEIAKVILIHAQAIERRARAESAMEVYGNEDKASVTEVTFLEEVSTAVKAHKSAQQAKSGDLQAEGWFDDALSGVDNFGKDFVYSSIKVGKLIGEVAVKTAEETVNHFKDSVNMSAAVASRVVSVGGGPIMDMALHQSIQGGIISIKSSLRRTNPSRQRAHSKQPPR